MMKIWKLSHGYNDIPKELSDWLDEHNYLSLHESTKKSQGQHFINQVDIGDIVSLSRSGDLKALVKVTSDILPIENAPFTEGWVFRQYEIIHELPSLKPYHGDKKGWTPNYNGTFFKVPKGEWQEFEEWILKKYYDCSLKDLGVTQIDSKNSSQFQWVEKCRATQAFDNFLKKKAVNFTVLDDAIRVISQSNLNFDFYHVDHVESALRFGNRQLDSTRGKVAGQFEVYKGRLIVWFPERYGREEGVAIELTDDLESNEAQLNAELVSNEAFFKENDLAGNKHLPRDYNNGDPTNSDLATHMTTTSTNLIYYGPPGTGKTFTLQKILKEQYTENSTSEELGVWLNNKLSDLSWFEIITLILLDADNDLSVSDIVNHEYFIKKLALNGRTANIRQTAWAALQTHAIQDSKTVKYAKRIEPLIFDKDTDSKWTIVDKEHELIVGFREQLNELKAGPPVEDEIKRFEFVTFHQSYGYEEFIEGLRPVTNDDGDISYVVKPGILKRLCKRAEADSKHQYALVIDEINRGNISKIFGELISLIEIDKRAGKEHSLTVTLPYSNLPFSVPSNLDIIGTMNTADRSLTHIDIALRRRFEFKELRTDYSLLSDNVDGINLRKLLFTINKRIELLLDREHIIGHALLMKVSNLADLKQVFITNIMPLLEEYFFEDWDKIKQVFNGNGFVSELKDAHTTWLGDSDEYAAKSYFVDSKAFDEIENYTAVYQGIDDKNFVELFSEQEQN
ncbi:AAA family ATPase [Pseudoalteromonas sp. SG41-5]|uniref:McrB family protein n=1 Tax=Pseudoalteromonas sp. SG41-5 TaxID=2760975 RepID=UPI00160242D6|nr:AAA family ATPase [Pseudoalteromonas sp. SG41-5]MBB1468117.1 AAA family ATPase [Pseudoalteromonas sp. SG41-5]